MNAPRYKTSAKQGLVYDAEPSIAITDAGTGYTAPVSVVATPTAPVSDWHPIASAPLDGRVVMLKATLDAEGPGTPAVWHHTRVHRDGRWQSTALWGDAVTKWPIKFEPRYWRRPGYAEGIRR